MTRVRVFVMIIILLAGAAGAALVLHAQRAAVGTTYSVAQVQALLARHRRAWGDRVIRIRGTVTTTQETFPCRRPSCALVGIADAIDDPQTAVLWLGQGAGDPFWTAIRRLPLLGHIAPRQQQPIVAQPATYRILLLARPDCSGLRCYDAVLLDAQPPVAPSGALLHASGGGAGASD